LSGPTRNIAVPPSLRPAVPQDLRAVEDIVRRAYTHYIDRIGRPPGPMTDDYAALIAAGHVYLAEQDDVVRGVLVLIPPPSAGDAAMLLDNVAVDPLAQGRGLGRMMLDHAERTARAAGCRSIRLYTNQAMTENISLYGRLGYAETHRAEETGLRRIYMSKPLD